MLNEEVCVSDIYRLGLDGHLTLSAYFVNHARVLPGQKVISSSIETKEVIGFDGEPFCYRPGVEIDEEHSILLDEKVVSIEGVWDLLMVGNEAIDMEYQYQQLTGGPEVELTYLDGVFLQSPVNKLVICQLQEHYKDNEFCESPPDPENYFASCNYYPAGGLPSDAQLVVRIEVLRELEESWGAKEKDLSTKRKNSYLKTIAALSEALIGGMTGKPNTDAEAVLAALASKSVEAPIKNKALANYLKEAGELE